MSGRFITIEGGEGVGKSTQARRIAERLRASGATVLEVHEPGGTSVGDRVRAIVLDHPSVRISPRAELLLYEAARAELTATVIVPALERGETVVCDRFFDSSTAYQGYGRGPHRGGVAVVPPCGDRRVRRHRGRGTRAVRHGRRVGRRGRGRGARVGGGLLASGG